MKTTLTVLVLATVGLVVAAWAHPTRPAEPMTRVMSTSAGSVALSRLQFSGMSPDEKETYLLRMYEPWSDAGRRVVLFAGAAVTSSGLASHFLISTTDTGQGATPIKASGERFDYTLTPATGAWSTVNRQEDVLVDMQQRN